MMDIIDKEAVGLKVKVGGQSAEVLVHDKRIGVIEFKNNI